MTDASYAAPAKADPEDKADLPELRRMLDSHSSTTMAARLESVIDIDYYDGKQLTPKQRTALRARKQPDIVINRTRVAVNGILGVTQRGKSEPRAYPRTPKDEASSDVATDALRYAAEKARFSATKLDVFRDMLVPGTGAVLVGVDADLNVTIEQIRWEEFVYDPRSRRPDFGDAHWMGIAKWMFVEDAKLLWKDKADQLESCCNAGDMGALDISFQDRPLNTGWVDRRARRLMIVELYYKLKGQWVRTVFAHNLELEHGPSPYLDEKKRPVCPIEAQSAYVDRENGRYGAVRDMRGVQDEINQRRSKALHWLSVRQIQEVSPGAAMVDADTARKEAARPDGVIPSGWQVVPGSQQAVADNLEMLQEAKSELERMGPNPAVLGREGTDASGRALLARQQAGLVELAVLFGGLEDLELRIYRQVWAREKQFWTAPMWVRVTDDEGSPQFVGLNQPQGQPLVHPDQIAHPETGEPMPNPQAGQPVMNDQGEQQEAEPQFHPPTTQDPFSGQQVPHPQAGQPILGYKNAVGEMDIDIVIDTTPDTATLQAEQLTEVMQAIAANPLYAQQMPLEGLIQLSPMTHKKDVIDMIEAFKQQSAAAGQQQQQRQQQIDQREDALAASTINLNDARAKHAVITGEAAGAKGLLDAHQKGLEDAEHAPHPHNTLSPSAQAEAEAAAQPVGA